MRLVKVAVFAAMCAAIFVSTQVVAKQRTPSSLVQPPVLASQRPAAASTQVAAGGGACQAACVTAFTNFSNYCAAVPVVQGKVACYAAAAVVVGICIGSC